MQESEGKDVKKARKIVLAREMFESGEVFPFPGITAEAYTKIKNEEEEYPGFATPIDKLIERCKSEGIKVVLGKHPESGNVFILPSKSNDIEKDNLFPRHLQMADIGSEKLRTLIALDGGQE